MRSHPVQLSTTQRALLLVLGRLTFATVAQLVYWVGLKQPTVTKTLKCLEAYGFVVVARNGRPHIISATSAGLRAAGLAPLPKRHFVSWSVMAHHCHRNAAEIRLREHFTEFEFQSRQTLYAMGLSPAHGEHYGQDGSGASALVLLDDYLMQSDRIAHAWARPHTPNTRYYDLASGCIRRWRDVTQRYILAVTDRVQYENHKTYIRKHRLETALLYVEGLWQG